MRLAGISGRLPVLAGPEREPALRGCRSVASRSANGRPPARPDAGRPEDGRPEAGRPEAGRPEVGRPDTAGQPGTGHGPPAAHPARRHRPVLHGRGHPAHRDPAAGRPGRGRPDARGNLPRRDLRHGCQSDGRQSRGDRRSAGRRRGRDRGRAGRCSPPRARFCLLAARPPMTCVTHPGRPGRSRCGTRPAWPPGELPFPAGHQFRGELQIPGSQPRPVRLRAHAKHQFPGRHQFRGTYLSPVGHLLRHPGRGGFHPGCRSERRRGPGPADWTLPGHAARAPRRAGCPTCWRGGPCFRRPRPARYRPGLRHYRRPGPSQCCQRARGPGRPHGHDQRRRWSGPGSAVPRRPGSDRALRRRIGRRSGPARLPRSVLRST